MGPGSQRRGQQHFARWWLLVETSAASVIRLRPRQPQRNPDSSTIAFFEANAAISEPALHLPECSCPEPRSWPTHRVSYNPKIWLFAEAPGGILASKVLMASCPGEARRSFLGKQARFESRGHDEGAVCQRAAVVSAGTVFATGRVFALPAVRRWPQWSCRPKRHRLLRQFPC